MLSLLSIGLYMYHTVRAQYLRMKFLRSFVHPATAAVGKCTTIRSAGLAQRQAAIIITLLSTGRCIVALLPGPCFTHELILLK